MSQISQLTALLERSNTRLLGNMFFPDSPGQMISEVDNFLRMVYLREQIHDGPFMAITPTSKLGIPTILSAMFPALFGPGSGFQFVCNDELFALSGRIHALRPELFIDNGTSHLKHALRTKEERQASKLLHFPRSALAYIWIISHDLCFRGVLSYHRRRWQSNAYAPLAAIGPVPDELRSGLGLKHDKIALVHIRDRRVGAGNSGVATDPQSLIPALRYLIDTGHIVVKMGHEEFPTEWRGMNIVDYRNSGLINYQNDLFLLKAAKFALINASGFGNLCDLMQTPMVYYGYWTLFTPVSGPATTLLPALMVNEKTNRCLSFFEQNYYYYQMPEYWECGQPTYHAGYKIRNPTADEILAATREAIERSGTDIPASEEQIRFRDIDRKRFFAHIEGRVSQYFLAKHAAVLRQGCTNPLADFEPAYHLHQLGVS